jgi:hypothetical protein
MFASFGLFSLALRQPKIREMRPIVAAVAREQPVSMKERVRADEEVGNEMLTRADGQCAARAGHAILVAAGRTNDGIPP